MTYRWSQLPAVEPDAPHSANRKSRRVGRTLIEEPVVDEGDLRVFCRIDIIEIRPSQNTAKSAVLGSLKGAKTNAQADGRIEKPGKDLELPTLSQTPAEDGGGEEKKEEATKEHREREKAEEKGQERVSGDDPREARDRPSSLPEPSTSKHEPGSNSTVKRPHSPGPPRDHWASNGSRDATYGGGDGIWFCCHCGDGPHGHLMVGCSSCGHVECSGCSVEDYK
jgi:hypothetical protein